MDDKKGQPLHSVVSKAVIATANIVCMILIVME